jgi:hypothetical protein
MESKVLPKHLYRDPAEIYEARELKRLGCRACSHHKVVLDRVMCADERNSIQFGVPKIGNKCRWFTLK